MHSIKQIIYVLVSLNLTQLLSGPDQEESVDSKTLTEALSCIANRDKRDASKERQVLATVREIIASQSISHKLIDQLRFSEHMSMGQIIALDVIWYHCDQFDKSIKLDHRCNHDNPEAFQSLLRQISTSDGKIKFLCDWISAQIGMPK